jgi:hypothetical protein
MRISSRSRRTRRPENGGPRYGGPDALDVQIDDLLANIQAENEAVPWSPGTPGRRAHRFRRTRRLGSRIRRVWAWRRTILFAATLMVSTGTAIVTVYLASRVLGG